MRTRKTTEPIAIAIVLLSLAMIGCEAQRGTSSTELLRDSGAIVLHDAIGEEIQLEGPARRVISMAPNLTEAVFAIGAGQKLVGRTAYCDYPPEAARIPVTGQYESINYEMILASKPDLILMTFAGNTDASYRKLKELGLKPFVLEATTIAQVINSIDTVGMLLGEVERAHLVSNRLRERIDSIRSRTAGRQRIRTFVVIDKSPLITVSRGFLSEALEIAGGENIASGTGMAYPQYSREELLRQDPEVILIPGGSTAGSPLEELLRLYPEWKNLSAVRQQRVYTIPQEYLIRPGPRIVDGIERMHALFRREDPDQ